MKLIEQKLEKLQDLCQQHAVIELYVFGSVLTDKFGQKSDIDFLVEFDEPEDPVEFGLLVMDFEKKLAQLFKREIDLVVKRYVQNPFFRKN
jgi:predicted nucleotidyltransferase